METKTLDERLRAKARNAYGKKLEEWKESSMRTLGLGYMDDAREELGLTNSKHFVPAVLDALIRMAKAKELPRLEQSAVDDFLRDFEQLNERVESIEADN